MMDATTGLLPGQAWNVAAGPTWQARIGRDGRAHVIGQTLAMNPEYRMMYQTGNGLVDHDRPWEDFDSAMDRTREYNAAFAAKRQEQGGDA